MCGRGPLGDPDLGFVKRPSDPGTHADLIAEAREWLAAYDKGFTSPAELLKLPQWLRVRTAALEEAGRQLAKAERRYETMVERGNEHMRRAQKSEAALKVATDALEEIASVGVVFDAKGTASKRVNDIAREALAAIRQEPQP